jgi:Xaa-Pro dipeptidase
MNLHKKIADVQNTLKKQNIDGWLLYDFRRSNNLACSFLEIPEQTMLTRRFFYWIPKSGNPVKIVSSIEVKTLQNLPGDLKPYTTWQELEEIIQSLLQGSKTIAMEYSPRNCIPYVSKVDAGTMEVIKGFGVNVVSSADMLQQYTSVWDKEKWELHLQAADVVSNAVDRVWKFISEQLKTKMKVTEYDVQQLIMAELQKNYCIFEGNPICAVNAHSADPHYSPTKESHSVIKGGDFILIDLWCKKNLPRATYADITRVGVAASKPSKKQQEIFDLVKNARDQATEFIKQRFSSKKQVTGWEIDQVSRDVIEKGGYGKYFIHRTGHNINESDHGEGAHIDNFETHDSRQILPGTCFSIEPGIYLPDEFGVRLEYNVFVHPNGQVEVTGGIQDAIECLSKD